MLCAADNVTSDALIAMLPSTSDMRRTGDGKSDSSNDLELVNRLEIFGKAVETLEFV
jgi:hypothetical protein